MRKIYRSTKDCSVIDLMMVRRQKIYDATMHSRASTKHWLGLTLFADIIQEGFDRCVVPFEIKDEFKTDFLKD